ncbi:hypothetical protein [Bizionia sp.]|uniref:hypothetical protein n=1 Tax=Bizionia sp. TaxID=1954480 RepID=UPI003A92A71B
MADIVLDTCTLVHANDENSEHQESSIELITSMLGNDLNVAVDEGFDMIDSNNSSYIGLEYTKHLIPGMLGFSLIQTLAINGRFNFVPNKVIQGTKKYIDRIIKNKKDRHFLRVAFNSDDKLLISHDFTDYQVAKRKSIKKDIKVIILTATEINISL